MVSVIPPEKPDIREPIPATKVVKKTTHSAMWISILVIVALLAYCSVRK